MARIIGRRILPSDLSERRVLKSLGVDVLRVSRRTNPYQVARAIQKIARGVGGDLPGLRAMLKKHERPVPPQLPDSTSSPHDGEQRAA